MLRIFSCVCWLSVCLLWRSVYLCLCLFFFEFFFKLSYMSCLCILEMNPLSAASFENTFSHSKGCLAYGFLMSFRLAYGFLWCAKVLSLIRSYLFIFVFIFIKWKGGSRKILLLNWCIHIIIPLGFENFLAPSTKWCLRLSLSSYYKLGISNFSKEPWSLLVKNDI